MPQAPKQLMPHVSARHRFGAELRTARIGAGMSQAGLAALVHVHRDLIAKVEKAQRWPTQRLANACDIALNAEGRIVDLWVAVAEERRKSPSTESGDIGNEQDADGVMEPLDAVGHRLWRLGEAGSEAAFDALGRAIDNVVQRYETEGPTVLARDATRLRRRLESMLDDHLQATQRRRLLMLAGQASGLLAYMAVNLGYFHHAEAYGAEAFLLAREADDRGLMAWVRGTQSFAAYYQEDYAHGVALAEDGLTYAKDGPQAVRLLVNGAARSLAFVPGRRRDAERAVAEAYATSERLNVPPGISSCISLGVYGSGRVIANAITVFQTLQQHARAIDLVATLTPVAQASDSVWSRSLISLDHATALLRRPGRDVEQAMDVASSAVAASASTPITSVLLRGRALAVATAGERKLPAVQAYVERLRQMSSASGARWSPELFVPRNLYE